MTGPVDLAHDVHGPDDAPWLVLGASLGTDRTLWREQMPALTERFRVLRYDHRGHGGTPKAGHCSIADLGTDVLHLMDLLGVDRAHHAGVSLGGMVALWLAEHAPERVDRLAMVCSSAHMPPAQGWLDRAAAVRRDGTGSVAAQVAARWFTPAFAGSERADELRRGLSAVPAEGYADCCEAIAAMDLRPDLASVRAPLLVVAGAQDPATPTAHAEVVVAGVSAGGGSARLVVVDDAAHLAGVEQSAAVAGHLLHHLLDGDTRPPAAP